MADTIDIKIIDDLKSGAGKMQESINNSSLSREQKDINTAKLREALNLLDKGANMTAQDLNRVSGILRSITQSLVKAYAGTEKVVEGLKELQVKLQKEIDARDRARDTQKNLLRHKIKVNEDTGEVGIRKAEVARMLKENPVKNSRGENYTSVDAVYKAAEAGNEAAKQFLELVKQRLEDLKAEYSQAQADEATASENIKTTTADIDKLKSESPEDSVAVQMQEFGNELQNLIDKLKAMADSGGDSGGGDEGGDDDGSLSSEELDKVTKSQDKQTSSLGKAFKQFTIYAVAVRTVKKALKEAVGTVKELDKYLTEQAMVTGKTRKETYDLLKQYQNMASALGATTKEVAEVATQFMRQGKSTADSLKLTNAAISAAKVAGISAAESVDYLTTALNGFQLSAENAMSVSDKFAAIAATSATSYEEIATALSKVAAQANLAGMSIDYTTALLAKGIETTREAPETIGTALKTVIARMREMGDYGETLAGDETINNVERQLAYVGIALRDANGELRSTEDVLDELGHKWDDLNSNQQAAIAKALAGTRQQSRLIAMMNDYERVTELQQIAQRSAGATMAQMSVYTEGMEAALNRVSTAWEKIVSTVTDSEVIVTIVDAFTGLLNVMNGILDQSWVLVSVMVVLGLLSLNMLNNKLTEMHAAERQKQLATDEELIALNKQKIEAETNVEKKKTAMIDAQNAVKNLKNLKIDMKRRHEAEITALVKKKDGKNNAAVDAEILKLKQKQKGETDKLNADIRKANKEREVAEKEYAAALGQVNQINDQIALRTKNVGLVTQGIGVFLSGIMAILTPIVTIMGTLVLLAKLLNKEKREEYKQTIKNTWATVKEAMAKKIAAAFGMASSASAIPYVGWVIAAAILATLIGAAIVTGAVMGAKNYQETSTAEGVANNINKLSNEIYTLNKQAEALESVGKQFDAIDSKVLKTNKDLEEMKSLLDSAGDDLNSENVDDKDDVGYGKGVSQKEYYESLDGDEARRRFLEQEAAKDREKANQKRAEQLRRINDLRNNNYSEFTELMTSNDAAMVSARQAIYALNNNALYEYIDTLDTENKTVETLTQSLLGQLDAYTALEYANNPQKIEKIVDALKDLKTVVNDTNDELRDEVYLSDVLTSDDYSIKDKTEAWREAQRALQGNGDALEAFQKLYSEYAVFDQMGDATLQLIDELGITVDKINELATAYKKLRNAGLEVSEDYWQDVLRVYAETGKNMELTINTVFGSYLNALGQGTDEYVKAYNAVVKVMEDLLADSILNIGQNMDKLKNSVSGIYEKANSWNTMSETDKTQFLLDNADLFSGPDGAALLQAFETGNYAAIEKALSSNGALRKQLDQELRDIEERLKIEENRKGDEYNASLVKYLREQKKLLEDGTKIFQASLEDRLNLEQKQLDIYKEYLKKEKDALTKSLNDRKEAYEKYFDAINQEAEDEEYQETADRLVENLSKLSTSGDAASVAKTKELEKQLEELEKERLQTLRERAQEQVLSNIDDEINQISEKFDELLDTDAAILAQLQSDINGDTSFLTKMLTQGLDGKTLLQAQDYLENTFKPAFGSVADLSDISIEQNRSGDLILNVAGREINLTQSDSDDLSELIYAALMRLGITSI